MTRNVLCRPLAISLFLTLASGCSAPQASRPVASARAIPAQRTTTAVEVLPIANPSSTVGLSLETPAEPLESLPFTIPLPANLACKLEDGSNPSSVELGLSRAGPGFGVMRARSLVARIGVGEREVVVDATGTGLRLRAVAVEGGLHVYAASPVTFEDLLVPEGYARLGVVAGVSNGIETSLPLPKQIVMPKRNQLTARVPCAALRLQTSSFDILPATGVVVVADLAPGATAIATTAAGKAVAMLNPHQVSREVRVLERDGRHTQIGWAVAGVVVVGWVDRSRLRDVSDEGDDFGAGGLGLFGSSGSGRRVLKCADAVPLRAQAGNRTEIIGVVSPQTPIEIERERPYAYEVDLPATGLRKHDDAVLLIDKEQVAHCHE